MKTRASHVTPAVHPPAPAARRGAWIRALALALAVVAAAGVARADALKDGKDALAQGRIDDAVAAYRNAVQASPNEAAPHLGLGLALEKKRAWEAALAEFVKASELDPGLAEPLRGAGSCYLRLNQPDKAEAAFRKATQLDRKYPDAQLGLGEALAKLKRYDEAIAVLNAGLRFGQKTQPAFYMGIGHAQAARDSLRSAEIALVQAREAAMAMSAPPSTLGPIYRSLGDLYMQRKIPELAIQNYQQAKSIDPGDLDTRMALGDAFYNGHLYNDALGEYKAVVEADSDYAEGYLKLGNLYYLASFNDPQRDFDAINVLEILLKKQPTNLQGKALLAQAYYRTGSAPNKQKALDLLNEVAAGGQMPPEAYPIRARIEFETADYDKALDDFRRAKRLETLDQFRMAAAYRNLAQKADSARAAALYDSANVVYGAIYAADTTTADAKKAQFEKANLLYSRKKFPEAIAELSRTIALDPNSAEAYKLMGLCYRGIGDDANAVTSLKKSVTLDPKQPVSWLQLGAAYDHMKDDPNAIDSFQHAAALDSSTVGAIALQQIGYKALVKKNYPVAVQNLEESSRRDPKQLMTWLWLAQAHQNSGNRVKAIENYRQVLAIQPGNPIASKALKTLGAQ